MFAALYLPPRPYGARAAARTDRAFDRPAPADDPHLALIDLAQAFVPRFEAPRPDLLLLDVSGLGRLLGAPQAIGDELRRAAADRGLRVHIALAATRTAAWLLAHARAGVTCLEPGHEASALARLPLDVLQALVRPSAIRRGRGRRSAQAGEAATEFPLAVLRRWGLETLGDLAALPPASLSARLGQAGLAWQRLARGEELPEPLVPWADETRFETRLELEWPVEGLEPLAFVLGRLLEPLAVTLERRDRAAVAIHLRLRSRDEDRLPAEPAAAGAHPRSARAPDAAAARSRIASPGRGHRHGRHPDRAVTRAHRPGIAARTGAAGARTVVHAAGAADGARGRGPLRHAGARRFPSARGVRDGTVRRRPTRRHDRIGAPAAMPSRPFDRARGRPELAEGRGHGDPRRGIGVSSAWGWRPAEGASASVAEAHLSGAARRSGPTRTERS